MPGQRPFGPTLDHPRQFTGLCDAKQLERAPSGCGPTNRNSSYSILIVDAIRSVRREGQKRMRILPKRKPLTPFASAQLERSLALAKST